MGQAPLYKLGALATSLRSSSHRTTADKMFDIALREHLTESSNSEEINSFGTDGHSRAQRRRFQRVLANVAVLYSVVGDTLWQRASTIDLSAGGVRIWSVLEHAPGVQLSLRFRLPKVRRLVRATGRIVMSFFDGKTHEFSHGVAFTEIEKGDQETIVQLAREKKLSCNRPGA